MTYAAACKLRLCARCWLASVLKDIRRLCRLSPGSEAHKRNSLGNGGTIKENGNTNPDSIVERNTKQGGCCISQCGDGRVFLGGPGGWGGFDCINFLSVLVWKKWAVCSLVFSCAVTPWKPTVRRYLSDGSSHLIQIESRHFGVFASARDRALPILVRSVWATQSPPFISDWNLVKRCF